MQLLPVGLGKPGLTMSFCCITLTTKLFFVVCVLIAFHIT